MMVSIIVDAVEVPLQASFRDFVVVVLRMEQFLQILRSPVRITFRVYCDVRANERF